MTKKFFKKNVVNLATYNDYFVIDAEKAGISDELDEEGPKISTTYSRCAVKPGMSPESTLTGYIQKKKKGEYVNQLKYDRELEIFLTDTPFISSVVFCLRGLLPIENSEGDFRKQNIFIVYPKLIYKALAPVVKEAIEELVGVSFRFIFLQDYLKNNWEVLEKTMNSRQLTYIEKAINRITKRFKIEKNFRGEDDYIYSNPLNDWD